MRSSLQITLVSIALVSCTRISTPQQRPAAPATHDTKAAQLDEPSPARSEMSTPAAASKPSESSAADGGGPPAPGAAGTSAATTIAGMNAPSDGAMGATALGRACSQGAQCVSGHCVNDVCCEVASCGPCSHCSAEASGRCVQMHDIDDEGSCSGTQTCSSQGECLQDGDKTNDIPDQFFKLGQSGYEYYPAVAQSWIVRVPGHLVEMRLAVACTGEPSFRIGIERLDDASRLSGVRVAQIDTANVPQTGTVKFEGLRLDAPLRMQTGEKFAVVIERNANRGACKVGYTKKNPSEGWLLVQQESDGGGPEWTTQFGALNFQILVKP